MKDVRNLAQLKRGEKAVIKGFTDKDLSLKLMEMGCLPGALIEFCYKAPLGDPIAVRIAGYTLSLRITEARTILIEQ
ncbi:MAG: ferrous iron transport protein A [Cytophagales bacterium]|nr:ferrous iron transport protein A [Cytophagales bacterium]